MRFEPKFENYTVARDGFSLLPFQPYIWPDRLINVNNKAYTYENNSWSPLKPHVHLDNLQLVE